MHDCDGVGAHGDRLADELIALRIDPVGEPARVGDPDLAVADRDGSGAA